jgi:hypothetical protein
MARGLDPSAGEFRHRRSNQETLYMRFSALTLALGLALAPATAAFADTIVLDGSTGADYDAVGDGWFFAGGPAIPPDGVGDSGNNALAIALQSGVLELRAMAEFPLASLAGLTSSDVTSATLTVTIDDVLSGFGPGSAFDGTAASPFVVYHYPADGTVTVADFAPAGLAQVGLVTPGVVTDATLAVSGALPFVIDVTDELKAALTGGDAAFGALMGTLDSPTGTSLDNLAPPGVAGGALPFLTIQTIPQAPPVLSAAEQACQSNITKSGSKLVGTLLKSFGTCFSSVLKDFAPDSVVAQTTIDKCVLALDPGDPNSKLGKALAKFVSGIPAKCQGVLPADIGSPCDPVATTFAQTAACLQASHLAAAQDIVSSQYANACTLLNAVGLDADYPVVCVP